MTELEKSYAHCEIISERSGSSFYRSFGLLRLDRRKAINALYAFARVADDATDNMHGATSAAAWNASAWHEWLDGLSANNHSCSATDARLSPDTSTKLNSIELALADAIARFQIDTEYLHDIIRGVDMDMHDGVQLNNWSELRLYCQRVASSVGLACLSIWLPDASNRPTNEVRRSAIDCGIAFQLTNILRDIVEDAAKNRIYFPADELERFGIRPTDWLACSRRPIHQARLGELGDWRGLLRVMIERANAFYDSGWGVASAAAPDGQRMFSLIWHTYRQLLKRIENTPERVWQERIRLSLLEKTRLLAEHAFTPSFESLIRSRKKDYSNSHHVFAEAANIGPSGNDSYASQTPRVAIVGGGLAGINAAMHLARHGCKIDLYESKSRLGGRVGSFSDPVSEQSIDYCQHVGMYCCSALRQWIEDTGQTPLWLEQDTLHFASMSGKRLAVSAWPLPAPFHLSGLLARWPQLTLSDRFKIGRALLTLWLTKNEGEFAEQLAIDWLREHHQSDRCIQNFWATILVSALGEHVDRVAMGPVHKVLIDGFAAHRRAFHLLVPSEPFSELMDVRVRETLGSMGVRVHCNSMITKISRNGRGNLALRSSQAGIDPKNSTHEATEVDTVIIAIPWNRIGELMQNSDALESTEATILTENVSQLGCSPITGIHTWWDRPWLDQPHAILINRLCQWIFPAPSSHKMGHVASDSGRKEFYYQVVISASGDLPKGSSEEILRSIKKDLAEVFPESAVASLLRGRVVTDPHAVFSVAPGHEAGRIDQGTFARQGIWFAGDWTRTHWPATMEGALRSGSLAAQGVLAHAGRRAKLLP